MLMVSDGDIGRKGFLSHIGAALMYDSSRMHIRDNQLYGKETCLPNKTIIMLCDMESSFIEMKTSLEIGPLC